MVGPPGQRLTQVRRGLAGKPGSACGRASARNYHVIMCRHSRG